MEGSLGFGQGKGDQPVQLFLPEFRALDVAPYTEDKTWFKKLAAWPNAKLVLLAKDY
jgi:hypothetical protein